MRRNPVEPVSAPAHPALERADGAATSIGCFALRKPVDAHQHKRPTLGIGQQGNSRYQPFEGKRVILPWFLEQRPRMGAINVLYFATAFAQIRNECIAQDREQLGAQLGIGLVAVALCPCLEEGGLDQILGPMFVSCEFQRAAAQGLGLLRKQKVERMSLSHGMSLAFGC